jgi:hypothetical protein
MSLGQFSDPFDGVGIQRLSTWDPRGDVVIGAIFSSKIKEPIVFDETGTPV